MCHRSSTPPSIKTVIWKTWRKCFHQDHLHKAPGRVLDTHQILSGLALPTLRRDPMVNHDKSCVRFQNHRTVYQTHLQGRHRPQVGGMLGGSTGPPVEGPRPGRESPLCSIPASPGEACALSKPHEFNGNTNDICLLTVFLWCSHEITCRKVLAKLQRAIYMLSIYESCVD